VGAKKEEKKCFWALKAKNTAVAIHFQFSVRKAGCNLLNPRQLANIKTTLNLSRLEGCCACRFFSFLNRLSLSVNSSDQSDHWINQIF